MLIISCSQVLHDLKQDWGHQGGVSGWALDHVLSLAIEGHAGVMALDVKASTLVESLAKACL